VGSWSDELCDRTLARLEAIEAVKQLNARYFRGVDTKDWDLFRKVFADDAVLDNSRSLSDTAEGDAAGVFTGGDAIVDYVRSAAGSAVTVHIGAMPEIAVLSPTEAEGVWKMEDVVNFGDDASGQARLRGVRRLHGYGHYHEATRHSS